MNNIFKRMFNGNDEDEDNSSNGENPAGPINDSQGHADQIGRNDQNQIMSQQPSQNVVGPEKQTNSQASLHQ